VTPVPDTWLLIDVNNYAHQIAHRGGRVELAKMDPVEIRDTLIPDMLEDYVRVRRTVGVNHVVWCFDGDALKLIRKQVLGGYKQTRQDKEKGLTSHGASVLAEIRYQIRRLRQGALPAAGFNRILFAEGYEGDDHVAAAWRVLRNDRPDDDVVIISSDKDLYQCLDPNTYIHRQEGMFDFKDFRKKYGVLPHQWAYVKALAGCPTDDVPGVPGVGEKTAIKYLLGTLPKHHKVFGVIEAAAKAGWVKDNLKLVRLPMAGCPEPHLDLVEDDVTPEKWARVCRKLGAMHLTRHAPVTRV
jgi:5'-3' exonuclease